MTQQRLALPEHRNTLLPTLPSFLTGQCRKWFYIFTVVVTGGTKSSHVKMIVYWGTFSLAYNNGNFYPFHLFKAPGARASWRAGECACTRGIWRKMRHLRRSPEKPAIKSQQPWRRTEIAHCVCLFCGHSSPWVCVTYRCFWSHGYCSKLCNRFVFPGLQMNSIRLIHSERILCIGKYLWNANAPPVSAGLCKSIIKAANNGMFFNRFNRRELWICHDYS